jgi:hypothetical protein
MRPTVIRAFYQRVSRTIAVHHPELDESGFCAVARHHARWRQFPYIDLNVEVVAWDLEVQMRAVADADDLQRSMGNVHLQPFGATDIRSARSDGSEMSSVAADRQPWDGWRVKGDANSIAVKRGPYAVDLYRAGARTRRTVEFAAEAMKGSRMSLVDMVDDTLLMKCHKSGHSNNDSTYL